ncbi:hypothetical protein Poli38472_011505 [Pythium oligandrum]|uniref:Uncharacterized protein n=1 Tax=Pythium oligandrum TaxID=41045 RepID=A0A8K1CL21_PYTOL|nr:hypothetical protein Poli38472_011505 [Pythium oligandrum]|eukprot:TMW64625.1 hypothetical protein Poli38472_011505 [Pythium oligandrum]
MKLSLVLALAAILSTTAFAESYDPPDVSDPESALSEGLSTPETTQPESSWSSVTEPPSSADPTLEPLEGNTQAPAIPETYAPEPELETTDPPLPPVPDMTGYNEPDNFEPEPVPVPVPETTEPPLPDDVTTVPPPMPDMTGYSEPDSPTVEPEPVPETFEPEPVPAPETTEPFVGLTEPPAPDMTGPAGYDEPDSPTVEPEPVPETFEPEPVPDTLEPQPFPEPNWDDIFGRTNDRPNPYSFPISPADREVAPFWVVDADLSERVTPDEWQYFVHRLYAQAVERIEQGADSHAVELLHNIVGFHYQTLQDCINARIHEDKAAERVSEKDFPQFAQLIQSSCYVKFRYSLLAGPPPFEWIAKKNPTVTASQVEAWFRKRLAIAKHDVEVKKIVEFTPEEHEFLARVMDCTFKELQNLGETPIDRGLFYQKTDEIEHCVHKD